MSHLEPTYLRYIYDGLVKGSIHPENAAELPDGLIGLYEEAFDERTSVFERQKLLQHFAIWALLKKEVRAAFVAEVLGETEDDIQDFISTYSAWFNSPESGKYQLYHERLKVYLLQKMSEGEIHELHEQLIARLEQAIATQKADEFEWYGLEFLVGHLAVAAMLNGDGKKLIELAYSQTHLQRQLKISQGYTWTKNGLKEVMSWASKYNDDEVIECGLQMVDLHHQEQNAAPQIVQMVADGDFDAALKRIEEFGGSDKEGLQRKFILYMLCLMELTLLESKNKPFRKDGIEKLLKHLDEQLPVDHSVLNWNVFFPSYMMFQMACVCAEYGLDYLVIYARTQNWNNEWIKDKGIYTDLQFEVLMKCSRGLPYAIMAISSELAKQGKIEESESVMNKLVDYTKNIRDIYNKCSVLVDITSELAKQGRLEKAYECVEIISNDYMMMKSSAMKFISIELAIQGRIEEALKCAMGINDYRANSYALQGISSELTKQGKFEKATYLMNESLKGAKNIRDEYNKSCALEDISIELVKQGKIDEAFHCIQDISNCSSKSNVLNVIFRQLFKIGKEKDGFEMQKALEYARDLSDNWKSNSISYFATVLFMQGNLELSKSMMQEAIAYIQRIGSDWVKDLAIFGVTTEYAKQGEVNDAIEYLQYLSDPSLFYKAILGIVTELANNENLKNVAIVMEKSLVNYKSISFQKTKNIALQSIYRELTKQRKFEEAIACARGITNQEVKCRSLFGIISEIEIYGKVAAPIELKREALECARGIGIEYGRIGLLMEISSELNRRGKIPESASMIQEAVKCVKFIRDNHGKSIVLREISSELLKQGKNKESGSTMQEALHCAKAIIDDYDKSLAIEGIASEWAKQGKFEDALKMIQIISRETHKSCALKNISSGLAKIGKIEDAHKCALVISDFREKSRALQSISIELSKRGKINEASDIMQECLECTESIIDENDRSWALENISSELVQQGKINEAFECIQSISDERAKTSGILIISIELAKQGMWYLAEDIGLGIQQIAERQNCWKNLAENTWKEVGFKKALQQIRQFQNIETKMFYSKGLSDAIDLIYCSKESIIAAQSHYLYDIESLEKFLQNYSLLELFIKDAAIDKIDRLNRTLNIQWAIDIKNQLPN